MEKLHKIKEASRIFKVLADPTRLAILRLLEGKELNVTAISEGLEMEQSAISHQLKTLKDARLVKARRDGKSMIYSQLDGHVYEILAQMFTHVEEKDCD
ncbi:ArsR/SmtB family transcription factor [Fundicoccus sp. Sow4_D5]|uniref:ArsR/SmtB family transcription factor n=1 Tax=unclassified Fundicoccus TaxID=2761543 RepID=UPI003F8EBD24